MSDFHKGVSGIGGLKVLRTEDYSTGLNGLPKSDVLKFYTENGSIVVRPSGMEPKLKTYISVTAEDKQAAEKMETMKMLRNLMMKTVMIQQLHYM